MLIALIVATFILTGGGVESLALPQDFDKKIETAIPEEDRREEIQRIIDNAAGQMAELGPEMQTVLHQGRNINLDYTATEADFKPIIVELLTKQKKAQQELIQLHFQLREKITEEEWGIIFSKAGDNSSDQ